jgi:hypothetical protein
MSIYTERFADNSDNEYYRPQPLIVDSKKAEKIRRDPTKHYPNKDEAALLRKIMAETGLNEDEVRSDRHYCELLSEAQKEGQKPKRSNNAKAYQALIKLACKQTGLVPQHPDTIKALEVILEERSKYYFSLSWLHRTKLTAQAVVDKYANK